jgi:predicted acyltransferase
VLVFPINKLLWTSSFVLFTGGLALISLAACLWAVDLRRRDTTRPGWIMGPFVWLGTNAIFAYLASGLVAKLLHVARVGTDAGTRVSAWDWAYMHVFSPLVPSPALASLVHSTAYALTWMAICGWMHKRRVFLKL